MAWKDSITLLKTDIKTSKNSAKGNYLLGGTLWRHLVFSGNENNGQTPDEIVEEAIRCLKHAIELCGEFPNAAEELGNIYFDYYKDVAKSLHYYAMVLPQKMTLQTPILVLNQTPILLYTNQISSTPEEIIQSCDELLKVKPDLWEAYYIKGVVYGKSLNNAALSFINLEKVDSFDFPKTVDYYNNAGYICMLFGNYEKALQYLLKAVELGTDDYITYLNIGIIYQQFGDTNKANFYMQKSNEMKDKIN